LNRTSFSPFKKILNGEYITKEMLTIQQVKTILKNQNMPDEEAEEIRDGFRSLAEIIFEQWEKEKEIKK